MKRSNRLVLIIGIVLAVAAFAGVIVLSNRTTTTAPPVATTLPSVYARTDIALGTVVTQDMVEARPQELSIRPGDAVGDVGLVVGKTIRTDVKAGAEMSLSMFTTGAGGGAEVAGLLDPGLRAIAVTVDQNTGVGTLINVGDRVDLVVGFTGDKFPQVTVDVTTHLISPVLGINPTTTKLLLQNMQVIGTLAPPPPASTAGGASGPSGASGAPSTALTGASELVILAVTAQQAEVIKFAQLDGQISLVLRSPKDFHDANGVAITPPVDETTGIVLKTLIDDYGILPPKIIEATGLPTAPAP